MDSLEMVADMINSQHDHVRSNIVLSMFKLAEVHADVPDKPASAAAISGSVLLISLLCVAVTSSSSSLLRISLQGFPTL